MFITLMQIGQMLVGVGITIAAYYFQKDPSCDVVRSLIPWCCAMYATYLYFFLEFFVVRFFPVSKGAGRGGAAAAAAAGGQQKKAD